MILRLSIAAALLALPTFAQQDLMVTMRTYTEALGVTCEYCHSAPRGSGQPEPRKNTARAMAAMTRDLNAKVLAATGKDELQVTHVDCATCHRGVAIPKPLTQILTETLVRDGVPALVTQYDEMRKQFYGRAAYDFGENTLIAVARRIVEVRPADAIAILEAHLKYFPNSATGYEALGYAYTRRNNDADAIKALEKAVELDPNNITARGRLEQLKSYRRR
jgi:tetratricopeptide (TPR) repeat protein